MELESLGQEMQVLSYVLEYVHAVAITRDDYVTFCGSYVDIHLIPRDSPFNDLLSNCHQTIRYFKRPNREKEDRIDRPRFPF